MGEPASSVPRVLVIRPTHTGHYASTNYWASTRAEIDQRERGHCISPKSIVGLKDVLDAVPLSVQHRGRNTLPLEHGGFLIVI